MTKDGDKSDEQTYSQTETEARLGEALPHWYFEDGCIQRQFKTGGWRATLMLVNTIGHLAEAAFHHPDIVASYSQIKVCLSTHSARGITDKDFALAKKIEEVLLWQPGIDEHSVFEGIPNEPRFKYVDYDS